MTNIDTVTVKTLNTAGKELFAFCSVTSGENCVEWVENEAKLTIKRFVSEYEPANTNIYIEVG